MLQDISQHLQLLTQSIDFFDEEQAEKIIDSVVENVGKSLDALICELYQLEDKHLAGEPGPKPWLIRTFKYHSEPVKQDTSKDATEYIIYKDDPGLWTWVYQKKTAIWIEGLNPDRVNTELHNKLTDDKIPPKYARFYKSTYAIATHPLLHEVASKKGKQKTLWGIFNVELAEPKTFTREQLKRLEEISTCLTDLIWKADAFVANKTGTKQVIKQFVDRLSESGKAPYPEKTGVFVYSPETEKKLKDDLKRAFNRQKVRLISCLFTSGTTETANLEKLRNEILKSHFAVFDITKCVPEVLISLGMGVFARKACLTLKDRNDGALATPSIPGPDKECWIRKYDINQEKGEILCFQVDSTTIELLDSLIESFCKTLSKDNLAFRHARDWFPENHPSD